MLCPSSASQQHPGAFSDTVPDRHRCNDQMVAWKTCPQGISLKSTLVPFPKSSITVEEISPSMAFPDVGPPGCWTTRCLAILLPSKQSSSNIRPSFTSSAITNRPLKTGRRPIQQHVVANPGQTTKLRHSILQLLTGYYPVLFSTRCFHRSLP